MEHRAFRRPKRAPGGGEPLSDAELEAARSLVGEEVARLKLELLEAGVDPDDSEAWAAAWEAARAGRVYVPGSGAYVPFDSAGAPALVAAYRAAFARLSDAHTLEGGRLAKAEARVGVMTKGYEMRAGGLNAALAAAGRAEADKAIELAAYARLAHDEAAALAARLAAATAELAEETERQDALQGAYASAVAECDSLRVKLAMAGVRV